MAEARHVAIGAARLLCKSISDARRLTRAARRAWRGASQAAAGSATPEIDQPKASVAGWYLFADCSAPAVSCRR